MRLTLQENSMFIFLIKTNKKNQQVVLKFQETKNVDIQNVLKQEDFNTANANQ